ncbi:hypothetical protein P4V41_02670 [Fictibacillus nanhaiensis]|uniref:hypothetical protein n=1 Tax=Fictibacillus nanhaiensis TaxID=742169 RepID=UPI002E2158DE|nr:hypothetical protein [Fictibacillus nanhaiensis]
MKTKVFIVICLAFLITGCNLFKNDKLPIEMIAFNYLTNEEQKKIPVSPKDSVVKEITVSEELGQKLDKKLIGKTIYTVTFNHTEDDSSGKLVVYIAKDKKTVIGKGYERKK